MGTSRRGFLAGFGAVVALPVATALASISPKEMELKPVPKPEIQTPKTKVLTIPFHEILDTVFEHVTMSEGTVPEFPLDFFHPTPMVSYCGGGRRAPERHLYGEYVRVPLFEERGLWDLWDDAFELLCAAAMDHNGPMRRVTHEIVNDRMTRYNCKQGIIQLDLTRPDAFVYVTRGPQYGLAVLDGSNIGMKQ